MDQKFTELQYTRPDMDSFRGELEKAIDRLEKAETYAVARAVYFDLQEYHRYP